MTLIKYHEEYAECIFHGVPQGSALGPMLLLVLVFTQLNQVYRVASVLQSRAAPTTCQECRISLLPASSAELPSLPLSTHPSSPQSLPPSLDTIFIGQIAACLLILLHVRSFWSCCYGSFWRLLWSKKRVYGSLAYYGLIRQWYWHIVALFVISKICMTRNFIFVNKVRVQYVGFRNRYLQSSSQSLVLILYCGRFGVNYIDAY